MTALYGFLAGALVVSGFFFGWAWRRKTNRKKNQEAIKTTVQRAKKEALENASNTNLSDTLDSWPGNS